jgi:hypothetical protein
MTPIFSNNAQTVLASPISNVATTIVLAAGTGAEFPNPSAGQFFTLSLNDAATGEVYEITWCTARVGDTCTVLRGQEGTTARAWVAGDIAFNGPTAATMNGGAPGPTPTVRTLLTGATNYYVATAGGGGDDSNPGTAAQPWLTLQHASNVIWQTVDMGGHPVTVNIANGSYPAPLVIPGSYTGGSVVTFLGTNGSANVNITVAGNAISVTDARVAFSGLKISATGTGVGIYLQPGANVQIGNDVNFGPCGSFVYASQWSVCTIPFHITISGSLTDSAAGTTSQGKSFHAGPNSTIDFLGAQITLSGNPRTGGNSECGFLVADSSGAFIDFGSVTFVGTSPSGGNGGYSANGGQIDTTNNSATIIAAGYSIVNFSDVPGNRGNYA